MWSRLLLPLSLAVLAPAALAVEVRNPPGTLHGFPSMSDESGRVIADGELTQELRGDRLLVHARWSFRDGRVAREAVEMRAGRELWQERFSWVETERGKESRRFEVDFRTGKAFAVTLKEGELQREDAQLELPRGRSFAGYGTALAVGELPLDGPGAKAELTFVAFTPKPRTVTLEVRHEGEEGILAAGRSLACDRFTLHPKIPFPAELFVGAKDAHLWFTHRNPRTLLRAKQSLAAKDDPQVVIDVIPRGAARPSGAPLRARRAR